MEAASFLFLVEVGNNENTRERRGIFIMSVLWQERMACNQECFSAK